MMKISVGVVGGVVFWRKREKTCKTDDKQTKIRPLSPTRTLRRIETERTTLEAQQPHRSIIHTPHNTTLLSQAPSEPLQRGYCANAKRLLFSDDDDFSKRCIRKSLYDQKGVRCRNPAGVRLQGAPVERRGPRGLTNMAPLPSPRV